MREEFSLKKLDYEEMKKDMAVATEKYRVKGPQKQFEDPSRDLASELLPRTPCDRDHQCPQCKLMATLL